MKNNINHMIILNTIQTCVICSVWLGVYFTPFCSLFKKSFKNQKALVNQKCSFTTNQSRIESNAKDLRKIAHCKLNLSK